jgi:O-succinylbenzoic acid--CoA ligase
VPVADGEGFDVRQGVREFRTADRGEIAGGLLRLLGRTDDVVTSGGVNVALEAVDRVVREQPGVRDCLVVAVPSERWGAQVGALLVDADPAGPALDDAVRAAVRHRLGTAAVPRLLHHVDRLPLAGVGKPDRAAAVALLRPARTSTPDLGDHGSPHPPTEETT